MSKGRTAAIALGAAMTFATPASAQGATCGTYAAGTITQPAEGTATSADQTACGTGAVASAPQTTAIGGTAAASNDDATAVGYDAVASGRSSTAIGSGRDGWLTGCSSAAGCSSR